MTLQLQGSAATCRHGPDATQGHWPDIAITGEVRVVAIPTIGAAPVAAVCAVTVVGAWWPDLCAVHVVSCVDASHTQHLSRPRAQALVARMKVMGASMMGAEAVVAVVSCGDRGTKVNSIAGSFQGQCAAMYAKHCNKGT